MTASVDLAAVVGSLKAGSVNRAVAAAAAGLLPPGATLTELDIRDVPFYDRDVEAEGDPAPVAGLKAAVEAADGLVFFTPEYNRSIPALTKNVIDWLSRVPGDSPLSRSIVGVVAATPGRHDGGGVRAHMRDSLSLISGHFFEPTLGIASVTRKMTDGRLTDHATRSEIEAWLASFVRYVEAHRSRS